MANTRHPGKLTNYNGSLEELAQEIGNMRYDQVYGFIKKLADDIDRQAKSDLARGRKKLAKELLATAECLNTASSKMAKAWEICVPYM